MTGADTANQQAWQTAVLAELRAIRQLLTEPRTPPPRPPEPPEPEPDPDIGSGYHWPRWRRQ